MSYALKTSGIATALTMCVIVDDDGSTVTELVSADVNSNKTVDSANMTISTSSWKSSSRGYFETKSNGSYQFYGVHFTLGHRPSNDAVTAPGMALFMACAGASAGTGSLKSFFGDDGSRQLLGRTTSGPVGFLLSANYHGSATTTLPSDGITKFSVGVNHEDSTAGTDYFYGLESGSLAADGSVPTDIVHGSAVAQIYGIGGAAGQGTQPAKFHIVARFNRPLTLTEFQSLHDDWFGTLIASGGGTDTTAPTQTGSIVASNVTSTSYTLTWPAGADNVAVTGYEYLLDGGTTYIDAGNLLTVNVTGRTSGSTDSVKVRCYDAAGNRSTPALTLSVTLDAATGSFVTEPIINNTGTVRTSQAVVWSWWPGGRIGAMASITPINGTGTTDGSGALTVSGLALGAGVLLVAAQVTDATDDDVYYEAGTVA